MGLPDAGFREMLPTPAPFVFGGSFSDYMKQGTKFQRFATLTSLAGASNGINVPQAVTEEKCVEFLGEGPSCSVELAFDFASDILDGAFTQLVQEDKDEAQHEEDDLEVLRQMARATLSKAIQTGELSVALRATSSSPEPETTPEPTIESLKDINEQKAGAQDVNSLYAAAREQGVGTVDHIEMPEGSLNIVNLVAVAQFIEKSWGLWSSETIDDMHAEAEECESDDEEEEECQADCESECSTEASQRKTLDISSPVVYSGTFQDYKKGAAKFTRFQTLTRFSQAACVQTPPPRDCDYTDSATFKLLSSIVPDILSDIASQLEASRECHLVIEGSSLQGHVPCRIRPGMQMEGCVLTTESVAIVENMFSSTMAGAKRTAKMIMAGGVPEAMSSPCTFKDVHIPMKSEKNKFSSGHGLRDDGCSWDVDTSSVKAPVAFVSSRRRSLSQRTSGSSWGGAGSLLEPICQGKLLTDHDFKVRVPKLPGARA